MKATRELTVDGFVADFGTNFLGHFALTGHLCDLIVDTPHSRVVTVSSITHRRGRIHFDDLTLERDFEHQRAYAQSKLANLLFMFELGGPAAPPCRSPPTPVEPAPRWNPHLGAP